MIRSLVDVQPLSCKQQKVSNPTRQKAVLQEYDKEALPNLRVEP